MTNERRPSEIRRALRDLHKILDDDAPGYMSMPDRARAIVAKISELGAGDSGAGAGSGGNGSNTGKQRPPFSGARGGQGETRGATRREAGLRFGPRPTGPKPAKPSGGKSASGDNKAADAATIQRFIEKLLG